MRIVITEDLTKSFNKCECVREQLMFDKKKFKKQETTLHAIHSSV